MIINGFLQQSAFDAIDMYSVPEKQIALLHIIMEFYKKGKAAIKNGVPLVKILTLPVREEIGRLKSRVPNDNLAGIKDAEIHLEQQFDELVKIFSKSRF